MKLSLSDIKHKKTSSVYTHHITDNSCTFFMVICMRIEMSQNKDNILHISKLATLRDRLLTK